MIVLESRVFKVKKEFLRKKEKKNFNFKLFRKCVLAHFIVKRSKRTFDRTC